MYVALSYAIHERDEIRAHAEWSTTRYEKKYKPKTIILLDENRNKLGFNLSAKNTLRINHSFLIYHRN